MSKKPEGRLHRFTRSIISRLANLTPGVVYYAEFWPTKINGLLVKVDSRSGERQSAMTTAAIAVACALDERLKVGDVATFEIEGVTRGTHDVGNFRITAERLPS